MSEFIVMKNVKKTYKMGEVMIHAVDGVDIEIHKGEFAVIVGPSGAGKTTLLQINIQHLIPLCFFQKCNQTSPDKT